MRLAVHTYPFRALTLSAALDVIAGTGVSSVDLWLGHGEDEPENVLHELESRNLRAVAVSAGGFYAPDSERAARAFRLAQVLGAPVVAACVGPSVAGWVDERVPSGLTVAVENHWDQPLARSFEVSRAIAPHARLSACLDTGHTLNAGERPERASRVLAGRLAHVHLKDARLPRSYERLAGRRVRRRLLGRPEAIVPGQGALDIGAFRAALHEIGYRGAVAVEYEGDRPAVALASLIAAWREAAPGAQGLAGDA